MNRATRRAVIGAALAVVVVVAGICATWAGWVQPDAARPVPTETTTAPPGLAEEGSARELLGTLAVSDHADVPGYDADAFGWRRDTDRNGCDTRNDVLRRDLSDVSIKPGTRGCVVASGTLQSPYSGDRVAFVAGSGGGGVDIDHVIARENAWQSGASAWSAEELERFGNDPLNLLAVESSLNRSHGSRAADEWLPGAPEGACDYAARQVAVKAAYALTVTTSERNALAGVLAGCPNGGALPEATEWPDPEG